MTQRITGQDGPPSGEDLWELLNARGGFGTATVLAVQALREVSSVAVSDTGEGERTPRRPTPADLYRWVVGDPEGEAWVADAVAGDSRLRRLLGEMMEADALAVSPVLAAAASASPEPGVADPAKGQETEIFRRELGRHRLSILPSADRRLLYLLIDLAPGTEAEPRALCMLPDNEAATARPLRLALPAPVSRRIQVLLAPDAPEIAAVMDPNQRVILR